MEEIEAHSFLNVRPNPTTGIVEISYGSTTECPPAGLGGILRINIINEYGKTVYTEIINDFNGYYIRNIDLSKEMKGLYIIEVVAGKQKRVVREIIE